jgi:hypothetical protein
MIQTLADTIVWMAEQRQGYQNLNSAIHSVLMDLAQPLMEIMAKNKPSKSAQASKPLQSTQPTLPA